MMTLMVGSNMTLYLLMGLLTALSFAIILYRTGMLRKALGYPVVLDVTALAILVAILHSTILGTLIAIVGALSFSVLIGLLRWAVGYERLERRCGRLTWVCCRPPLGVWGGVLLHYWLSFRKLGR